MNHFSDEAHDTDSLRELADQLVAEADAETEPATETEPETETATGTGTETDAGQETDTVLETEAVQQTAGDRLGRRVLVLNGVNLGRLGMREPDVYGSTSHAEIAERLVEVGHGLLLDVQVRQTDDESEMVRWLHEAADGEIPVVLNPAAWSHYSIALRDAVAQRTADLVEVHLSNIHSREEFRHHSVISAVSCGVIAGLGPLGYELALQFISSRL